MYIYFWENGIGGGVSNGLNKMNHRKQNPIAKSTFLENVCLMTDLSKI